VAEVSESVRHELSAAWRTVSAREARLVEDELSEVTEWPAPFVACAVSVYRLPYPSGWLAVHDVRSAAMVPVTPVPSSLVRVTDVSAPPLTEA